MKHPSRQCPCLVLLLAVALLVSGCGHGQHRKNAFFRVARQFYQQAAALPKPLSQYTDADWQTLWQRESARPLTPQDRILQNYLRVMGQQPDAKTCRNQADLLLGANKLQLRGFKPVPVSMDWHENPLHSRDWQQAYYALQPIYCLDDAYRSMSKPGYLQRSLTLLADWQAKNTPLDSATDEMDWNDHGTATRLMVLTDLWLTLRQSHTALTPEQTKQLVTLADQHLRLLQQPGFFNEGHNHSYFQSAAVFMASETFGFLPESKASAQFGIEHMLGYLQSAFTSEGVHKDHSMGYHLAFASQERQTMQMLTDLGQGDRVPQRMKDLYTAIETYPAYAITASNQLVPYGDTGAPQAIPADVKARALKGDLPLVKVFPESGYAAFRNNWDVNHPENMIHLFFTNSLFGKTHKHMDNLGFQLSAFGRDWLIDSGTPGTNRDKFYKHGRSQWAHNTIVIDGQPFSLKAALKHRDHAVRTQAVGNNGVLGTHWLYPGYEVSRETHYNGDQSFVLKDTIRRLFLFSWLPPNFVSHHTFDLYFQTAPDIHVSKNDQGVILTAPHSSWELVISVHAKDGSSPDIGIIRGNVDPLMGWVYLNGKPVPTSLVEVRFWHRSPWFYDKPFEVQTSMVFRKKN